MLSKSLFPIFIVVAGATFADDRLDCVNSCIAQGNACFGSVAREYARCTDAAQRQRFECDRRVEEEYLLCRDTKADDPDKMCTENLFSGRLTCQQEYSDSRRDCDFNSRDGSDNCSVNRDMCINECPAEQLKRISFIPA
jgi:hypothetical protein